MTTDKTEQTIDDIGATFSEDRKYRYVLWRIWDKSKPCISFIGLNPSTADENQNDPTIRRVISFAKSFGYGGVYMLNLFAYVTPYPEELNKCNNPVNYNDHYINQFAMGKSLNVVFCWGNFFIPYHRDVYIKNLFPYAFCLGKNKNGSPKHPLYLKSDVTLIPYSNEKN